MWLDVLYMGYLSEATTTELAWEATAKEVYLDLAYMKIDERIGLQFKVFDAFLHNVFSACSCVCCSCAAS
jgi:hypothetical protein